MIVEIFFYFFCGRHQFNLQGLLEIHFLEWALKSILRLLVSLLNLDKYNICGFSTFFKEDLNVKNSLFHTVGYYNVDIRLWVNAVFSIIFLIQVSSCLYRHDCGGSQKTGPLLLWKLFCRRSKDVAKFSFGFETCRYEGIYNYCWLIVWVCFQHLNTTWIDLPMPWR